MVRILYLYFHSSISKGFWHSHYLLQHSVISLSAYFSIVFTFIKGFLYSFLTPLILHYYLKLVELKVPSCGRTQDLPSLCLTSHIGGERRISSMMCIVCGLSIPWLYRFGFCLCCLLPAFEFSLWHDSQLRRCCCCYSCVYNGIFLNEGSTYSFLFILLFLIFLLSNITLFPCYWSLPMLSNICS